MSYQSMADIHRAPTERARYEMCIAEQGLLYAENPTDANSQTLGLHVVTGDKTAVDAIITAISVGPNSATLTDDLALLGAVQSVWKPVADAFAATGFLSSSTVFGSAI